MENTIDELDRKILQRISKDARKPFLEIARECDVSGAAIHQRVQKLLQSGILHDSQFIVDPYKLGYKTCAYIGIMLTDISHYNEVTEQIKEIPEIVELHATTGRYSLFVKLYAKDNHEMMKIVMEKLMAIPGISHTETSQISLDEIFHRQISL